MIPFTPLDGGLGLLMIALAVSTLSNPGASLAAFLPWPGVITGYYGAVWGIRKYGAKWTNQLLLYSWLFLILTSLAGWILHHDNRLAGITNSPNTLAVLINLLTPCVLGRFARKTRYGAILGAGWLVVLTRSRSGLIGFFIMLLVYHLPDMLRTKQYKRFARKTLIGLAGVAVALPLLRPDTLNILTDGQSNRLAFWSVALEMFQQNPVFGAGLGTFSQFYSQRFTGFPFDSAHNLALQLLAETGLTGLAGLFLTLAGFVWFCAQNIRHLAKQRGPLAGLAAFVWHSQLDTPEPLVMILAAVLSALVLDTGHIDQRRA